MGHLFIIMGFGVALLVTACDGKGNHRVSLKKAIEIGKNTPAQDNEILTKALEDKTCLRIDQIVQGIMKQGNETVLLYTYDLDLGTLGTELRFISQVDDKVRASAFFKKDSEPVLETPAADKIQSSTIAFLLSPQTVDEKCENVVYNNIVKASFKVIKKSASILWLQNALDPSEYIQYEYDRKEKLYITHFTPVRGSVCGKTPMLEMRKYVLARGAARNAVEIDRDFAILMSEQTSSPIELANAVGETSGKGNRSTGALRLDLVVLDRLVSSLYDDKFIAPSCP